MSTDRSTAIVRALGVPDPRLVESVDWMYGAAARQSAAEGEEIREVSRAARPLVRNRMMM